MVSSKSARITQWLPGQPGLQRQILFPPSFKKKIYKWTFVVQLCLKWARSVFSSWLNGEGLQSKRKHYLGKSLVILSVSFALSHRTLSWDIVRDGDAWVRAGCDWHLPTRCHSAPGALLPAKSFNVTARLQSLITGSNRQMIWFMSY